MSKQKVKCVICGKVTVGRVPKGGTGDLMYPRKHKLNGKSCDGNFYEADWIK
jgi:ribosomal protein S27E